MPYSFYFYLVLPNLILFLILWMTRHAKGFNRFTFFGVTIACVAHCWISVLWAKSMVGGDTGMICGVFLLCGYIGILIGTYLRDRRWRERN